MLKISLSGSFGCWCSLWRWPSPACPGSRTSSSCSSMQVSHGSFSTSERIQNTISFSVVFVQKIQRDAAVALEICLAGAWHSLQSERSAVPVPPPPVRRAHVAGSVMGGDGSLFSRPLRTLSPALSVPVGSGRVAMPLPLSCVAWLGLKVVVTVHARPPLLGARSAAFPPVQFEWN
jgi:hypothetical protein